MNHTYQTPVLRGHPIQEHDQQQTRLDRKRELMLAAIFGEDKPIPPKRSTPKPTVVRGCNPEHALEMDISAILGQDTSPSPPSSPPPRRVVSPIGDRPIIVHMDSSMSDTDASHNDEDGDDDGIEPFPDFDSDMNYIDGDMWREMHTWGEIPYRRSEGSDGNGNIRNKDGEEEDDTEPFPDFDPNVNFIDGDIWNEMYSWGEIRVRGAGEADEDGDGDDTEPFPEFDPEMNYVYSDTWQVYTWNETPEREFGGINEDEVDSSHDGEEEDGDGEDVFCECIEFGDADFTQLEQGDGEEDATGPESHQAEAWGTKAAVGAVVKRVEDVKEAVYRQWLFLGIAVDFAWRVLSKRH